MAASPEHRRLSSRASSSVSPAAARAPRQAPVRYRVAMPEPRSHEFEVTMEIPALPGREELELVFPAWAPGSYMVRDFVRHVYDLSITDGHGRPLPATRLDKLRWRVSGGGQPVRVSYRVFAFEQTVRTSYLDETRAYWNGTSLFFFVEGEGGRPCEVEVLPPAGARVFTALPRLRGAGERFAAGSYDELADSPFEVGPFTAHRFKVRTTTFEVVVTGRTNADPRRLLADLRKIVAATGDLFGGFPFDRYLFIIHALPSRGGGLEHAASTTLDIAGLSFEDEKGYRDFAELAAHEFFHAWNVKRIHDRLLGPFDYTRETHTRLLWFHEGFTEYMEAIILLRAGLLDAPGYLRQLAEEWPRYVQRPGRNVTPLSELSFEAWIKLYKPADNHVNRTVSYYEKGKWAALVLELALREATNGRRGVVDLFRRLWDDFGREGRGLAESDVRSAVDALAGRSMASYFERYIDGTDELPVLASLRRAGVKVAVTTPWDEEDDAIRRRRARTWTGITFASGDRAVVKTVVPASPAWIAGLTYGDELVAVAGQRVNGGSAARRFADYAPGDEVEIAYFRQDQLRTALMTLAESPDRRYEFSVEAAPQARARAVRKGWLGI